MNQKTECKHCNGFGTFGRSFFSDCWVCSPKDNKQPTLKEQLSEAQAEIRRLRRQIPLNLWRNNNCNTCGADIGQTCDPEKSCGRQQIKEQRELIAGE